MKPLIKIDTGSQTPVYKQLIQAIQNLVTLGDYKEGDFIPSMNELANDLYISKETVKKAYSILREKGLIESAHGKGFYITNNNQNKIRILLLFDKISTYKQVLYSSFVANIDGNSEITIRLHNQDVELFEQFIDENLDNFDYYIITPHFPLKPDIQKRVIKVLKKIPNRKLILLDHHLEELPGNYGSAYQDFTNDVIDGLTQGIDRLRDFNKLNVISMKGSMYAPLIEEGIKAFCTKHQLRYEIYKDIDTSKIEKQEVFLILNSQLDHELIELVKTAKMKNCVIGKDIGIISYNESPINEVILDGLTVFSTDFQQMGRLAAKMVTEKTMRKVKCDFRLVRRNTF
jgi:DNA-binding transcriptional regulator YhcF (GntR family)